MAVDESFPLVLAVAVVSLKAAAQHRTVLLDIGLQEGEREKIEEVFTVKTLNLCPTVSPQTL